jgi:hypothetical protein
MSLSHLRFDLVNLSIFWVFHMLFYSKSQDGEDVEHVQSDIVMI